MAGSYLNMSLDDIIKKENGYRRSGGVQRRKNNRYSPYQQNHRNFNQQYKKRRRYNHQNRQPQFQNQPKRKFGHSSFGRPTVNIKPNHELKEFAYATLGFFFFQKNFF